MIQYNYIDMISCNLHDNFPRHPLLQSLEHDISQERQEFVQSSVQECSQCPLHEQSPDQLLFANEFKGMLRKVRTPKKGNVPLSTFLKKSLLDFNVLLSIFFFLSQLLCFCKSRNHCISRGFGQP